MENNSLEQFDDEELLNNDRQFQQQLDEEEQQWAELQEKDYENM